MLEQVLEVESPGYYLHQSRGHLELKSPDAKHKLDLDAVGVLLLSSPKATLSTALLGELAQRGVPVLMVGSDYLPRAVLQPVGPAGFHVQGQERMRAQVQLSQPRRKRLWQSVVQAKIRNQAALLELVQEWGIQRELNPTICELYAMAQRVQSGDVGQREALAARLYWRALFGMDFLRHTPLPPNGMLNYGYTILLSCVVRATVACGLHPAFGIEHRSSRNPYCLASDLMESFRPFVDLLVAHLYHRCSIEAVDTCSKRALAQLLRLEWQYDGQQSSLSRNVLRYVQQFSTALQPSHSAPVAPVLNREAQLSMEDLCGLTLTR